MLLIFVLHSSPQPKQKPPRLVWPKSETILNHNVYWELPSKDPSGILLFAHGCNHAGSDMWPNDSKTCPSCLGLPEEQRIREIFLRRSWAVIAISSLAATQNGAGCWDLSAEIPGQDDLTSVPEIMKIITKREQKLKQLPIYALGASSGGGFVLLLPRTMHLKGIIAEIMAVPSQELEQAQQGKGGFSHPPTVFMHMPRDTRIAPVVADDVAVLESRGIPAMEVKVGPQAVTPEFLYEHSQGRIGYEMAVGIVGALRNGKFINEEGMLLEDPRRTHDKWTAAVEVITEEQVSSYIHYYSFILVL